jgi:hypothetical protein
LTTHLLSSNSSNVHGVSKGHVYRYIAQVTRKHTQAMGTVCVAAHLRAVSRVPQTV